MIGGGLAGSTAAIRLARAGFPVTLLEKQTAAHHKVCGEFLSHETVDYLRQAGVDPLTFGASPIRRVRLSSGRKTVEATLPFTALSLSRRTLDEAMLVRAAEAGCRVERGACVQSLIQEGELSQVQLRDGLRLQARSVFLATGKHEIRGWERTPFRQGDLVGFKMHYLLAPSQIGALRGSIELFLFPGGYGGLSLIEEDTANLCLVVRQSRLRALSGWPQLLASIRAENRQLQSRLEGAQPLWDRPLAISSIPYGYIAGRPSPFWPIGDQAVVIPSFTGDGMAIAMHSANLAVNMFLSGATSQEFQNELRDHLSGGVSLAVWISRAMVNDSVRSLAPFALSIYPGLMHRIAASTRIPKRALLDHTATSVCAR